MARGHGPLRELPLKDALLFGQHVDHIMEIEAKTVEAGVLEAISKIDFS